MSKSKKRRNNHHLGWPRRAYVTQLQRDFRELPCLKVSLDIEVHALLHQLYEPGRMPDDDTMEYFVVRHANQACACHEAPSTPVNILDY